MTDRTGTYPGPKLSEELLDRYGICAEMAGDSYVTLITSVADTKEGFERLTKALCEIDEQISSEGAYPRKRSIVKRTEKIHVIGSGIKDALLADDREYIPMERAEGRIAGDFVIIYPPGVPVAIPGEPVTKEAVEHLLEADKCGLEIMGLKDKEIAVLWERYST